MRLDALRSSHPIQVPIRAAREVEEVFDAISYFKVNRFYTIYYNGL
jgi:aminopeptidase N